MRFVRMRSTLATVSVGAYTAGDELSSNVTAAATSRASFDLSGFSRGVVLAAALDITPASGNFVTTAATFDLQLYKTAEVPAAVGDNVTNPIAGSIARKALGPFRFDAAAWYGPLGAIGGTITSAMQRVPATNVVGLATPVLQSASNFGFPFEFTGGETKSLTAVIRALAAWDAASIAQTFGISLDLLVE